MSASRLLIVVGLLLTGTSCGIETDIGGINDDTAEEPLPDEPVADAGADQLVTPLEAAQLDGSASYDPSGGTVTDYQWQVVSRPPGSLAEVVPGTAPRPILQTDVAGEYVLDLTVGNTEGIWDATPDKVTVNAKPVANFYVEVTWSTDETDLDVHFVQDPGPLWHFDNDVYWCNQNPEWGVDGVDDDPNLENDEYEGYGPEVVSIATPADGSYTVYVHYFGELGEILECVDGCGPTVATVKMYVDTQEVGTWSRAMTNLGDMWTVATIDWPSKTVTQINTMTTDLNEGC